jgi:hypothetical protein
MSDIGEQYTDFFKFSHCIKVGRIEKYCRYLQRIILSLYY